MRQPGQSFTNPQGKVIGRLVNGWLVKNVTTYRHMLEKPRGWCVDRDHLRQLEKMGARGVRLIDEKGGVWAADLLRFQSFGIAKDYGRHGEQVCLPERYWLHTPRAQQAFDI